MKTKIKLVLITILLISFQTIIAQEQQSTGAILNMKVEKTHRIVTALDNPASIAYAHNSQGGATLSMPIPAGTPWTSIGSWIVPNFGSSMIKGGDGNYYITDITPALFQFNTVTGAVTQLGAISGTSGDQIMGISFNPENSQYYMVSGTNFYSLNIGTRVATLVGNMGVAGSLFIDLAFDAAGVCYAYDLVTDAAYTINPATGVATQLGPLGYDANFGQGMSYDMETNTIYLSAFNNGTFTGQLRTMNLGTGSTTLVTDWGLNQLAPFALDTQYGPPCPVVAPSNPNPPNGATGLPLTGNTLSWTNGTGSTNVELWFGPAGNVVKVYDGPAITSFALPTLSYNTLYRWYVICKNEICGTQGPLWSFTTAPEPFPGYWCDEFDNLSNWTVVGPLGLTNWSLSYLGMAGGTPPELQMSWTPSFTGDSKIRSNFIPLQNYSCYELSFDFFFDWYADPSGFITVGITFNSGITSEILYSLENPNGNVGPIQVFTPYFAQPLPGIRNCQIEITYSGNSFNIDNIYCDNICITAPLFQCPLPAPSNLIAQVILNPDLQVQLSWQDNSFNEFGFNIYRDVEFIQSTEYNVIHFIDSSVIPGSTYTYQVFAFNGIGEEIIGSNVATIAVPVPVELILFTADVNRNVVTLFWQTATETNNSGFEVQRLQNSKIEKLQDWQRVGFVEGNGTTTEIQIYSFTDKPEPGIYKYRLKQLDFNGTFAYSSEVEVEVKAPNVFSLEQNYPNPFNPSTKIKYTIPETGNPLLGGAGGGLVTLKVYDILGNEVATLVNEEQAPGQYEVEFSVAQVSRPEITSGIYFYQLKAGSFIETKKMILLK